MRRTAAQDLVIVSVFVVPIVPLTYSSCNYLRYGSHVPLLPRHSPPKSSSSPLTKVHVFIVKLCSLPPSLCRPRHPQIACVDALASHRRPSPRGQIVGLALRTLARRSPAELLSSPHVVVQVLVLTLSRTSPYLLRPPRPRTARLAIFASSFLPRLCRYSRPNHGISRSGAHNHLYDMFAVVFSIGRVCSKSDKSAWPVDNLR